MHCVLSITLFNPLSFSTLPHFAFRWFPVWWNAQWVSQLLLQAWAQSLLLLPLSKWLVFKLVSCYFLYNYSICGQSSPRLLLNLVKLCWIYLDNFVKNLVEKLQGMLLKWKYSSNCFILYFQFIKSCFFFFFSDQQLISPPSLLHWVGLAAWEEQTSSLFVLPPALSMENVLPQKSQFFFSHCTDFAYSYLCSICGII